MGLVTRPVEIADGAWLTTRCIVLGGTRVGRSVLAKPATVLNGVIPAGSIVSGPECTVVGRRFTPSTSGMSTSTVPKSV